MIIICQVDRQIIRKENPFETQVTLECTYIYIYIYATVINYSFPFLLRNFRHTSSILIYQAAGVPSWIMEIFFHFQESNTYYT
jgi:hypothetical protein